jgi:hypothetical protein
VELDQPGWTLSFDEFRPDSVGSLMIIMASSEAVGMFKNEYGSAAEDNEELVKTSEKLKMNDENFFMTTPIAKCAPKLTPSLKFTDEACDKEYLRFL